MNYVANWLTVTENNTPQLGPRLQKLNILFRHLVVKDNVFHVHKAQMRWVNSQLCLMVSDSSYQKDVHISST